MHNGDYFAIIAFLSHSILLTYYAKNEPVRAPYKFSIKNERFTVVCSRFRLNLKFGHFTFSFGRLRQRVLLKCVPHVQHDYFSSFNQSDHCFLVLSFPLASSLLRPRPHEDDCKRKRW